MIRSLISSFSNRISSWIIGSTPSTSNFLVIGFNGSNLFVAINSDLKTYTSPDGITWSQASTGTAPVVPKEIAYSGTTFTIVGHDFNTGYPAIATSTDGGKNWTNRGAAGFGSSDTVMSVCWSGTYLVAVSTLGRIVTSTSAGSSWTQRYNDSTKSFNCVAYGGGIYVAIGYNYMATSTNGTTWTNRDSNRPFNYVESVAYGDSKFVAVGGNGKIATSSDGITWTERASPFSPFSMESVTYADGKFVAVGSGGKIGTSTDGITWVLSESPVTTTLLDVIYGVNKFVAIGNSKVVITSPTGL